MKALDKALHNLHWEVDVSVAYWQVRFTEGHPSRLAEPVPNVCDEELPQPEEPPSEDEEQDAEPTYIVPKGHGRFVLRCARLQNAANNFAKGNVQEESKLISNWLTTGLEAAIQTGAHIHGQTTAATVLV